MENILNNNNINNKIKILEKQLIEKNEELEKIKNNININNQTLYSLNDIIAINITTTDYKFNLPIKCTKNEIFAYIEEKLYKEYPEYRETNNYLLCKGRQILRFKTISENNIKDGTTIILILPNENTNDLKNNF